MTVFGGYPGTLCVCIDKIDANHAVSGKFFHKFETKPVAFANYFQMVLKADEVFDCFGTPVAFVNERRFRSRPRKADSKRRPDMRESESAANYTGEKATFIIDVQYRQHASWQGKISWLEGQKSESFRSVLELIKLMDSVIEQRDLQLSESEEVVL